MYQEPRDQTPHNLGLFRLQGFCGRQKDLLILHEWLTGGDDLPAIALSGEQGVGKSTLATAAAWNHFYEFTDGIIRVGASGGKLLRLYDIVRTMDSVFGTTMTRLHEDRWGISILEQLYRRRRLLIIDEMSGTSEAELNTIVDIISHLHEVGGNSRILLIDRNFSPAIAELVQDQFLHLEGIHQSNLKEFVKQRAPESVLPDTLSHLDSLYVVTKGHPFVLRLVLGLLLDYSWQELEHILQDAAADTSLADMAFEEEADRGLLSPSNAASVSKNSAVIRTDALSLNLVTFAVENLTLSVPQAGTLLNRLVSAAGGASMEALRELFWADLGTQTELEQTLNALWDRGLLEQDLFDQRVVMHPLVRRYMSQNAMMLGEEWNRRHATYYRDVVRNYRTLPLERWPQIDVEWGNIYVGADWCTERVERIWQKEPTEILKERRIDKEQLPRPTDQALVQDLRLAREYGLALAYYAFWRHPPSSLRWLKAGAVATLGLGDMRQYARLQTGIGRQMFFQNDVDGAIGWLKRACAVFAERDMLAELIYVYTDLATSLRILDNPQLALDYFYTVLELIAEVGNRQSLATAYMNLGSAHYSLDDYSKALEQHRKALRIAMRLNVGYEIASAYNNMGLALEGMNHLDEAKQIYQMALSEFRRLGDEAGISTCFNNLGSVNYTQGNFPAALEWYEQDLRLSEQRGVWTDMAATLHNLGHVALEQKEYKNAMRYFKQSLELYAAFELTEYVAEEEEMLNEVRAKLEQVESG